MKLKFDVTAQEYVLLRDILAEHLPEGVKVWVFGSRAKHTARFNSDIDLALEGKEPIGDRIIARLKDAFTEAPLPYRVDIVDMASVSDEFYSIIRKQAITFPIGDAHNMPKLRFSGFLDPLERVRLGEVAHFSKGKGISKSDITPDGLLPCIRYGELYTVYNTVIENPISRTNLPASTLTLSKGDEVLVPASGEDAKDIATAAVVKKPGIALGGDLNIIRSKNDGAFLASYLSGRKRMALAAMAQGNSVVHLYATQLKTLDIHLPSLPEQRKIASFLGAVDTKIAQLARKKSLLEDYKKGCMQQLFTQKIRFKDDTGKDFPGWKEKRLGEVFSWINTNSLSRDRLTYDGGQVQNIHYGDIHTKFAANFHQEAESVPYIKDVTPADFKPEQFCRVGDVVIADASEDYADIGKAIEIVSLGDTPMVAGLHTYIARPKPATVQIGFAGYLLRSAPIRRQIERIAQGISVLGISKGNLEKLTLFLPHPDEQRKIADFLSAIDRKIDLVGQELRHARTFKQGLLQQMFV